MILTNRWIIKVLLIVCWKSQHLHYSMGFPGGSDDKEPACNAGDLGSIPGLGRSPGEGNGYPLQYYCLGNSVDRGAWWALVHGVTKSWKQLRDFHLKINNNYFWCWDFVGGSDGKASTCNAGDLGSNPGLGSSPGEGYGNPLQYSCLENSMNGEAW